MKIKSYAEFKKSVGGSPRCGRFLFRGIDSQYSLLPSISYSRETNTKILIDRAAKAQQMFNKRLLEQYQNGDLTNYQLTFLSRHCGLISPCMDFTVDDTVAIQFGIEAAHDNPVHLYMIDISGEQIKSEKNGSPTSNRFGIFRPNLVWRPDGFLTQERTQLIQSARLITQSAHSLATPFNVTFRDRIIQFEIYPEDFGRFQEEILAEGIKMDANLLIDSGDCLFQLAKEINNEILISPAAS